jgi:hypothetical protein
MPITINPPKTLPRIIHNLLLEVSDVEGVGVGVGGVGVGGVGAGGSSTVSYRV